MKTQSRICSNTNFLRQRKAKARKGAAVVEFAVIAPVMIMLTFGLLEVGRLSMLKNIAVQSTREGARQGIKPSATSETITDRVQQELAIFGINDGDISIEFSNDDSGNESVSVRVSVPMQGKTWLPGSVFSEITSIRAESVMRRETTW